MKRMACVDKAIRTLSAILVLCAALPQTLHKGALARDFAQWGFYQDMASLRNPARFFPRPQQAVASPLTHPPLLPCERLLLIGGAGNRFAPPKHTRLIWDHWNHPRLHWFPGNPLIHLDQGRYLLEMEDFLHEIGFDQP